MEGIIAVAGFWGVILALVLKRPINNLAQAYIASRLQPADKAEIEKLKKQVFELENQLSSMTMQLIEMKDAQDFQIKLLAEKKVQQKK
ncbi:MAG TPA: hypothetical protein V6C76_13595 [Drouetiella sp.]